MLKLYPDVDKRLRRAADNNVRAHLRQLEDEGRLKVYAGKPRHPNTARATRDVEHAKFRQEIIKKAKKFEAEQRRAEIRAQENPPSAEWATAPRYELAGPARD